MAPPNSSSSRKFVIIGGGPAGLTAGYELLKHGHKPVVFEKGNMVGGISRTEEYKGYHFDMGGHRFFTKAEEVNRMWQEVLSDEFLQRPRLSRIFYKGKFFNYPLKPFNALAGLGVVESIFITCSYMRWQLFPHKQEDTLEQWVTNRFGKRLFNTFFKTYTEKVWGIPCSELKAEWAAQRIKDLSLKTVMLNMFTKPKRTIKTLIEQFDYPRLGPGMMWKAVQNRINEAEGEVHLDSELMQLHHDEGGRITKVTVSNNGASKTVEATDFISSMPVTEFVKKLDPPAPDEVLEAAGKLKYRDFLTVCLIVNKEDLFPDNWIYIHEPGVSVGRIQNFKNWSPDMVPDQSTTSLGLEYFCNVGDELWNMDDADLIELGRKEVAKIGLAKEEDVLDGIVCRVPKAYPVYDGEYGKYLDKIREYVDSFENFQTVGRNGLHRYNNQDHAMMTAMYAVRNSVLDEKNNLWEVNVDQEYHEEASREPGRNKRYAEEALRAGLADVLKRVDRDALGFSCGVVSALVLFLMTIILVLKGGAEVGPTLSLLNNYLPGYKVTTVGSFIGLGYGFGLGFVGGWIFAFFRNFGLYFYYSILKRHQERGLLKDFLDYV